MATTLIQSGSVKLRLVREVFTSHSIVGKMYLGDIFLCSTLEPAVKAIPVGVYDLSFGSTPKWSRFYGYADYKFQFRLSGVPRRSGILIHIGNSPSDSDGCILVGVASSKPDFISGSTSTYSSLCSLFYSLGKLHGCHFEFSDFLSLPISVEVK